MRRFIVWSPTGPSNPRCRHDSREEARRAARDMARQHRDQDFFVCELVDRFAAVEVTHEVLAPEAPAVVREPHRPPPAVRPTPLRDPENPSRHLTGCPCDDCIPF